MSDHAWCSNPARDEAVRAAEDNRQGPLPTLEEVIADPFTKTARIRESVSPVEAAISAADAQGGEGDGLRTERVVLEVTGRPGWIVEVTSRNAESISVIKEQHAMMPKSVSGSSEVEHENKGDGMGGSTWFPASDQPAPAPPFADGQKCSPAVSETGEGQSGLRTERVVLEVTHRTKLTASAWGWCNAFRGLLQPGESVRVVEEAHFDDLANMSLERDAAIRERESLREQLESVACRAATAENRVAELEAASKLAPPANAAAESNHAAAASDAAGTEPVAWGVRHSGHSTFGPYAVWSVRESEELAREAFDAAKGWVHFPLYAASPPARGWLTVEEREAVEWFCGSPKAISTEQCYRWKDALRSLLARSTPPEVVLEDFTPNAVRNLDTKYLAGWDQCMALAKRAISAAGVTWKEANRE